jgi:hypothetical protein
MNNAQTETPTSEAISEVLELRYEHRETWAGKSDLFWALGLLEEVAELVLSLAGLHKDDPEWELKQIAAITMNWLCHRRENRK